MINNRSNILLIVFGIFLIGSCYAQLPDINAEGEQFYCGGQPMPIVTDIEISANGSEQPLDEIFIQIVGGYSIGDDVLILSGNHPNISSSWSIAEGKMTLTGPASYAEFEAAILSIQYTTSEAIFQSDKTFSINLGEANFLPITGHFYEYVPSLGISWTEAKAAAESMTYFGLQGYLATITTPEEAQLTGAQSAGTGWIGGSDQRNEGRWIWETGPEEGQVFWNGLSDGSAPDGIFSFWNNGEPNNLGEEDYAHITDPNIGVLGSWNDLPNEGETDPSSPYHPQGFVVEYGGLSGEPTLNISASTIIITPKVQFQSENVCDEGMVNFLITESNVDTVFWFESATSENPIFQGLSYDQYITESTSLYILPVFDGCTEGNRIPISSLVYQSPAGNDITVIQCDDGDMDGISSFNLFNYFDQIVAGNFIQPISNLEISFYEDEDLIIPIDGTNYRNDFNNQIVYAEIINVSTTCFDVSEVQLQVMEGDDGRGSLEECDDFVVDGFTFFNLSEADSQLTQGNTNLSVSYYMTYEDALLEINALADPFFNTTPYEQTVYGRLNADGNCMAINPVLLTVNSGPEINSYEEIYYCLDSFPETVVLTGGVENDNPSNYYYNWSTGETTSTIEINEVGIYTVEVIEPGACSSQRTIRVWPSSAAVIESIEIVDASDNNSVSVFISGDGEYQFAIDNPNGPYQESNVFLGVTSGEHTVYIRDLNGCELASRDIIVIGFPKYFTPNGDGQNDVWQIKGYNSDLFIGARLTIFNRYGKILNVLSQSNPSWDGTYNGNPLPSSDYWFSVELADGRTFTDHFTLKR